MAFYNPQRVVFNPDKMVIQSAGKVGGVLYDIMSKNYDDKVKAQQFKQQMDLKQQEMDLNEAVKNNQILQQERNFDYQAKQDEFKNDLALKQFDFLKQKESENNALAWAKYNLDKDYKNKYLDYLANKNTSKINTQAGFSSIQDIFNQQKYDNSFSGLINHLTNQKITFDDMYGFSDTLKQKFSNTPFNNSNNFKKLFADKLKEEINLTLVNLTSGRMSNEDRHRLEELVKTNSIYYFDKYAKQDILKAAQVVYRVKMENLEKEYNDIWKSERYYKDPLSVEKNFKDRYEALKKEEEAVINFINGGKNNTLLARGQRLPLKDLVQTAEQPMPTAEELQQFIKFK